MMLLMVLILMVKILVELQVRVFTLLINKIIVGVIFISPKTSIITHE
jgi:hypothetical protein